MNWLTWVLFAACCAVSGGIGWSVRGLQCERAEPDRGWRGCTCGWGRDNPHAPYCPSGTGEEETGG